MIRHLGLVAAIVGGITLAGMVAPVPAVADPVKIGANVWVGFGPLWLAREKGFFKEHGVEVELTAIEKTSEKYAAFVSGKLDMVAGGAGTSLLYRTAPDQLQDFSGMDDSNGGDGVIAKNEITSLADLKGKTVAVDMGAISGFYLGALLKTVGLKFSDVKIVEMTSEEVGKTFSSKQYDAVQVRAVTLNTLLIRIQNEPFSPSGEKVDQSHNGLWMIHTDGMGLKRLTTDNAHLGTELNSSSQFPWSNASRDGRMYVAEQVDFQNRPNEDILFYGSLNGGTRTIFADIADGTELSIAGWTTM